MEWLAHFFGQKSQYEVSVFLQHLILPAIMTIGIRAALDGVHLQTNQYERIHMNRVDFHQTPFVEGNTNAHGSSSHCKRQCLAKCRTHTTAGRWPRMRSPSSYMAQEDVYH